MIHTACTHDPPDYLSLRTHAKASFRFLCEQMQQDDPADGWCICKQFAFKLDLLRQGEVSLSRERNFHLRPLDSWHTAIGEFTLRELNDLKKQVAEIVRTINLLKKTPLVRRLNEYCLIPQGDLLARPDFPCDSHFQTLLNLQTQGERLLGNPKRPMRHDFDSDLSSIYKLLHKRTGGWYDECLADVLCELFPNRKVEFTQTALKQWRYRNRLTVRRVTRK